jgi:hypothetical protein
MFWFQMPGIKAAPALSFWPAYDALLTSHRKHQQHQGSTFNPLGNLQLRKNKRAHQTKCSFIIHTLLSTKPLKTERKYKYKRRYHEPQFSREPGSPSASVGSTTNQKTSHICTASYMGLHCVEWILVNINGLYFWPAPPIPEATHSAQSWRPAALTQADPQIYEAKPQNEWQLSAVFPTTHCIAETVPDLQKKKRYSHRRRKIAMQNHWILTQERSLFGASRTRSIRWCCETAFVHLLICAFPVPPKHWYTYRCHILTIIGVRQCVPFRPFASHTMLPAALAYGMLIRWLVFSLIHTLQLDVSHPNYSFFLTHANIYSFRRDFSRRGFSHPCGRSDETCISIISSKAHECRMFAFRVFPESTEFEH